MRTTRRLRVSELLQFPGAVAVSGVPADAAARAEALDTRASFIVEAPAGSGKTGLIVQRFLKLLLEDEVAGPEDVLAITFTNKATAELLERVLKELHQAAEPAAGEVKEFERETRALAAAVLERDRERGWRLVENPGRLNIRSIDSVCAAIANAVPVLSGSGGQRGLLEDARPLYRAAASRTLLRLGGEDERLDAALRTVLLHRDGNLQDTESLLAGMLAAREQWGELVPLDASSLSEERLDEEVRPRLERALEAIVCAGLSRAARLMPAGVLEELAELAHEWSGEPGHAGKISPIAFCASLPQKPSARAEELEHWRALIGLVLKPSDGDWRKSFAVNVIGFKPPKYVLERLKDLVAGMSSEALKDALLAVLKLPPTKYPDEQWRVAKALFVMLRHALAELKVLFAESGECDFAELSLAAREALEAEPTIADVALSAGGRLRHLLVDEMQDTSAAQYELLEGLTRSWDGRSQTLFLVGDPKQSIYLFRQARVERFLRVVREERLGELPMRALQLTANFRSQAELVARFNDTFDRLFPRPGDESLRGAVAADVPFVEASAVREATVAKALRWHVSVRELDDEGKKRPAAEHALAEAKAIRAVVQRVYAEAVGRRPRVAVLARTRAHLAPVAAELAKAGVAYRAVEVESLAERQEVLDALALTRALLHPADRIAWLAVLHAPWCGLGLADLLALTGEGEAADRAATVAELVAARREFVSAEGQALLARAWPVLRQAVATVGQTAMSTLVERTWRSLGGDAALTAEALGNARRYFALLRELEGLGGGRIDLPTLMARLGGLYAEPSGTEDDVQLMTIHKAKGLEWDVVLVPGLERKSANDRGELLNWVEMDSAAEDGGQVLLAPIAGKGEPSDELNGWLRRVKTARDFAERKRVFYVACTRAREELHLFAMLDKTTKGELSKPAPGSLLEAAMPAARPFFERVAGGVGEAVGPVADQLRQSLEWMDELAAEEPVGISLAAAAEDPVREGLEDELGSRRPHVHRLPLGFDPLARFRAAAERRLPYPAAVVRETFARPEGSFAARAFGNVTHRFLELLTARLAAGGSVEALAEEVVEWQPRLATSLRGEGLPPALAVRESARVLEALTKTLGDEVGRWVLAPHEAAASEAALVTAERTLRADRSFVEDAVLWIVDFKTTEQGSRSEDAFAEMEMLKYREQMESYAALRRTAGWGGEIRLALYYPLVPTMIDWVAEIR